MQNIGINPPGAIRLARLAVKVYSNSLGNKALVPRPYLFRFSNLEKTCGRRGLDMNTD